MAKFAVYYIPKQEDPFYHLGTYLLGYNVRTQEAVTTPSDLQSLFGQVDPAWTALSHPFGLHLTITDALDCHWSALPKVERELDDLLKCFDPAHPFTLRQHDENPVGVWGEPGKYTLALRYEPNDSLRMLHTLLVARINPFGTGSGYLQRYLAHPHEIPAHYAQRMRLFYSPTVLDTWFPHFTIFNPYTGDEVDHITSILAHCFEPYNLFTMQSICLLIQPDDQPYWQIYREFPLGDASDDAVETHSAL